MINPIEFDEPFDRAYIPVNSRYEVQTKGKGSIFRIANTMTNERWIITDERLHPMLAELAQAQAEITRLQSIIAEMQQIDNVLAPHNNKELFNELKLKAQMYEYVRRLNAQQFAEIYEINIKSGVHFDHLIIEAMRGEG